MSYLAIFLQHGKRSVRPRHVQKPHLVITRHRTAMTREQVSEQEAAPDAAIAS